MRVLVVGGAGYIGSHMCKLLAESGHEVVVCDNLSTGHAQAVQWGPLEQLSIADGPALESLFDRYRFDAVMHFAACSLVGESMIDPLKYYRNNVSATVTLLETMRKKQVDRFVFSSTAAVFGHPQQRLIDEQHPIAPINPYGRTKFAVEQILADCSEAYGLRSVSLRYFNAAGADPSGIIGEAHNPETHLIPKLLRKAVGEDVDVRIFGTDYATADGTCIRDYVHVVDLCAAHLLALNHLEQTAGFRVFNLGNGEGYSVRQIVAAVENVIGRSLDIQTAPRRPGDPDRLVASSIAAKEILGWQPEHNDIGRIIETAWRWHRAPAY